MGAYWPVPLCCAVLCCALLCSALLCSAMLAMLCSLCYAMLCFAMLCYAMLCFAVLCCAMPCYAMPCCAVLCCAVLCYAMPCHAMLCHAMPCCAVLCLRRSPCSRSALLSRAARRRRRTCHMRKAAPHLCRGMRGKQEQETEGVCLGFGRCGGGGGAGWREAAPHSSETSIVATRFT
jgi:hypothetical protein